MQKRDSWPEFLTFFFFDLGVKFTLCTDPEFIPKITLRLSMARALGYYPAGPAGIDPAMNAVEPDIGRGGTGSKFIGLYAAQFPAALKEFPTVQSNFCH